MEVLAALSAVITVAGALWWVFKLGQSSGAENARRADEQRAWAEVNVRIQALEKVVADIQANVDAVTRRRRRA